MSPRPLIELQDITRSFGEGELAVPVLKGIDLKIWPGEFVAIMGPSGSGKSTLMNILGCLDQPSAGQYRFNGRDVSSLDRDELARLRRDAFGFVFQSYNLLPGMTARENVEIPAIYAGMAPAERHARAERLLTGLGLGERLSHRPAQLSGGQQQRVSIARALMNGGQLIFADEPTGALDSKSSQEVIRLLTDLSEQGHTIILITHDPDVATVARRQIRIADGEIVEDTGAEVPSVPMPATDQNGRRRSRLGDWQEALKSAVRSLHSNLFRTALTLLGIVIGVASVITMLAIGEGARKDVVDRISTMGSDLLLVRPGGPDQRGGRWSVTTLVPSDFKAINEIEGVLAAIPELTGGQTLRYSNRDHSAEINATSFRFPVARQWPVVEGTFFSAQDEASYAAVAVLGKTTANALFPDESPLGKHLMVNNVLFQVIGVMDEKGASPMGQDQDDVVFVPYTTGSLRIFGQTHLRNITVAVADIDRMDEIEALIHDTLMARHGIEDFTIRNMASLIETISETQNTLTWLLGSIAAISLLVGGIGVMNIMLVSVTERTREIGIRMATGARAWNILQQFLTEAWLVSAIGGLIGVVIGIAATRIIGSLGTPIHMTLLPMALAFGCAFATGLLFGFLPARKAAHLDPVHALASE
ncbi:macrolide transport system ATP-binding/permease protein [Marinobacter nauticus]|uniref:Pyoverdine export ATP-binding/permease protein PvdT n=1 Tax=Marinobacter nauticus TaxID=2743 RepID=A0A368XAS0_MARNT|nr:MULTISPECIES: MacB family efflux pump subunit [Marinobacter]ERS12008.1 ABC transporter [Marinobacter sp. EN3]RCW63517.1 macrolide transport system ATP-binding/permease protein [Marinobacter nauticus]CCG95529.1 fused macrolide transporter subunits of ABC superfamily: ATP-binding component; membrane component [Marinobacter nauticus ATCC 49840]